MGGDSQLIGLVQWRLFRPGPGRGARVYDYGSRQRRLVDQAGSGGTIWLVTSRKTGKAARTYHLAYKLVDCKQIDPDQSDYSGSFPFVVRSKNWDESRHFKYNEASLVLKRLQFASGSPMLQAKNTGLRLLSLPGLTASDIDVLESFENRILNHRSVFLSYAQCDVELVEVIEKKLEYRDIHVGRDSNLLRIGMEWKHALAREVKSSDAFMVLITEHSAQSHWVRKEVEWAVREKQMGGLVQKILPVFLDKTSLDSFPELAGFQTFFLDESASDPVMDRLANEISSIPQISTRR